MASWEMLTAFLLAMAVFAYVPGPAILYAVAQTIARGRRAGLMAAAGLHVGGYVHVCAASLGLSAALAFVPGVYSAVKFAGALYLIWLGIGMFRAGGLTAELPQIRQKSVRRAFGESMLVEILNPKAALFFVAFLPQFVDPAGALPVSLQLFVLGFVTLLAFFSADIVAIYAASGIIRRSRDCDAVKRWLNRIGGTLLIGLGFRLAMDQER